MLKAVAARCRRRMNQENRESRKALFQVSMRDKYLYCNQQGIINGHVAKWRRVVHKPHLGSTELLEHPATMTPLSTTYLTGGGRGKGRSRSDKGGGDKGNEFHLFICYGLDVYVL
jgi:hypothetical protein